MSRHDAATLKECTPVLWALTIVDNRCCRFADVGMLRSFINVALCGKVQLSLHTATLSCVLLSGQSKNDEDTRTSSCLAITGMSRLHLSQVHGDDGAQKVYASCLGDSKALLFDTTTGCIPQMNVRTWDHEVGTLQGPGVMSTLRAETFCHNLTGALINGRYSCSRLQKPLMKRVIVQAP